MKARDDVAKDALGMAIAAIQREEVAGEAHELTNDEALAVLTREVSQRKDSAQAYQAGNRPELADKELAEAAVLQRYLPAPLTDAELDAIVAEEVETARTAAGEVSMKQMGQIIKAVNARANRRAEGAVVAAKVKAALA